MSQSTPDLFSRYKPWRRYVEPGFWFAFYCAQAFMNSWIMVHDLKGRPVTGLPFNESQFLIMLLCSNAVMLALVPAVLAFDRRFPLRWILLRRNIPFHLLASMVYCIVHVLATVALIRLVFMIYGGEYQIVSWWSRILFQYVNDIRFYFTVIVIVNLYRLVLLRWQGEASMLDAPDDGPPVEPVDRPDRFLIRKFGKEFLLPATDIEWIQAWGNYVNLHLRGHDHPLRSTMASIETRLDPKRFIRVHRSYIINLDHMSRLEQVESGDARANMSDGTQVPVSQRYLDTLRKASAADFSRPKHDSDVRPEMHPAESAG